MAFRLVSSGGAVTDPAVVSVRASGTVRPGMLVVFSRTGGAGVSVGTDTSTTTTIFGICSSYAEGASDVQVNVIPFAQGQVWEADCANAATTAQIGLHHILTGEAAGEGMLIHNTATDQAGSATAGDSSQAVFRAIAMSSGTSGSGKLLGYFRVSAGSWPVTDTILQF